MSIRIDNGREKARKRKKLKGVASAPKKTEKRKHDPEKCYFYMKLILLLPLPKHLHDLLLVAEMFNIERVLIDVMSFGSKKCRRKAQEVKRKVLVQTKSLTKSRTS